MKTTFLLATKKAAKLFGLTVIPLNVNSSFLLFRQEIPEPFSAVAAQGCTYPQVSDERRKVQLEFQGCFPPNTKWYRNRDQYSNCRPTAMRSGKVIEIVIEQQSSPQGNFSKRCTLRFHACCDTHFVLMLQTQSVLKFHKKSYFTTLRAKRATFTFYKS